MDDSDWETYGSSNEEEEFLVLDADDHMSDPARSGDECKNGHTREPILEHGDHREKVAKRGSDKIYHIWILSGSYTDVNGTL